MRTKLIAIGNSRGVRLPKAVLEQCAMTDDIELEVKAGQLVLRAAGRPRAGWEAAFARMARRGDDRLLNAESVHKPTAWERDEWRW